MTRTDSTSGSPEIEAKLAIAESVLGHTFADRELLQRALTHPSASNDRDPSGYYERLEFLGDSVVGFVISEEVFRRFPALTEGGLTRIKVSVVAGNTLAGVAHDLGLADALILGESEIGTGKRGLTSALENSFESLTAALYLDAGFEAARDWVLATLGPLLAAETAESPENPKSVLQELIQARGESPAYRITGHVGPPHDRMFTAAVEVGGAVVGEGSGRTKKEAEAAAASSALVHLSKQS